MATKKTPRSTTAAKSGSGTTRRTTTRRRRATSALQPRRRPSRPGLPTTIGTALGTLVVTTLLDLSWPVRIGLIVLVLVVGLAYVVWKNRAQIAAGASAPAVDGAAGPPAGESAAPVADTVDTIEPASPVTDPPAPSSGQ